MSEKYKAVEIDCAYFITFTLVKWVEMFHRESYAQIVIDAIRYGQQHKGIELYGYVIMPSHVHLLLRAENSPINEVIRDIKKYTANKIIARLLTEQETDVLPLLKVFADAAKKIKRNTYYKVWRDGYHPIAVYSRGVFQQKLAYIHSNPVNAGLVELPEQYPYSSARNYADLNAELEIVFG